MSRKGFVITLSILAAAIGAMVCAITGSTNRQDWDVSYGMANAHISWQQTYHAGSWNE